MLQVNNLTGGILADLSFRLDKGKCLAVTGPSGSGKTTLLNILAGNLACSGTIFFNGENVTSRKPWQRPFRYLNQRLYLFPHLTVDGNLHLAQFAAGKKWDRDERSRILEAMGIGHLKRAYPAWISGGEQQRAALARALVGSPELLLLDEPFSSLDREIRSALWELLLNVRGKFHLGMLLVTHDPEEARALAGSCIQLKKGRIISSLFP